MRYDSPMKTITVTDYEYRFLVLALDEYREAIRAEEYQVPDALKPIFSEALHAIDQMHSAVVDAGDHG